MSLRPASAPLAVALAALLTLLAAPTTLAAGVTIRIGDRVDPATITIAPGTSVTFRNVDDDRHRMRTRAEPEFDTGNLEPGERFTVTFRTPGRYPYVDERDREDPAYHGTIVVRDGTAGGTGGGGTSGAGGTGGGSGAASGPVTIGMAGRAFSPASVTVGAGTRITFLNDDDDEHTATDRSGAFDTGVLSPGGRDTATLTAAGVYRFLCAIHPDMTGVITVTGGTGGGSAAPAPTPVATPAPTPTPSPVPSGGPGETGATVALLDFAFAPTVVELEVGTTLTARNDGAAIHTLTATDGRVDSGFLQPGATFQTSFAAPGTFAFLCSLHPEMTLDVRVLTRSASIGGTVGGPGSSSAATPSASAPASVAGTDGARGSAPTASAQAAGSAPPPSPAPAAATVDPSAFGRLLFVVILVGVACVAFAKVLGGTVRAPRT